jgi:general secretion pathway protein G
LKHPGGRPLLIRGLLLSRSLFDLLSGLVWRQEGAPRRKGFTLIEVLLATVLIGLLVSFATPKLHRAKELAKIVECYANVRNIGLELQTFELEEGYFPESLDDIGMGRFVDPWGYPFEYLAIRGYGRGPGEVRKDRFLVPLNADFDLYSVGPDGTSAGPLTAGASQDDIIRANDGGYIGLASEY